MAQTRSKGGSSRREQRATWQTGHAAAARGKEGDGRPDPVMTFIARTGLTTTGMLPELVVVGREMVLRVVTIQLIRPGDMSRTVVPVVPRIDEHDCTLVILRIAEQRQRLGGGEGRDACFLSRHVNGRRGCAAALGSDTRRVAGRVGGGSARSRLPPAGKFSRVSDSPRALTRRIWPGRRPAVSPRPARGSRQTSSDSSSPRPRFFHRVLPQSPPAISRSTGKALRPGFP